MTLQQRAQAPITAGLDPVVARWLRDTTTLSPDALFDAYCLPGPPTGVHVLEESVPAGDVALRARVYVPERLEEGAGCHVSLHGGGFTGGSIDDPIVDALSRQRSHDAGVIVVSVEYRLAPEHRYPGPLEDCYAAVQWAARRAAGWGADPDNLSVGGASAGANLAAACTLLTRERQGAPLSFQLLEVPLVDLRPGRGSRCTYARGYGLDTDDLDVAISSYLAHPDQAEEPHASPCAAPDLAGLPPAHVMTAELDPVRDGGEHYARRLRACGVPTTLRRHLGHVHGSPGLTRVWAPARSWQAEATGALRAAHARPVSTAGHHDGGRR